MIHILDQPNLRRLRKLVRHQCYLYTVHKKILNDNSIASKTTTFEFEGQLAAFTIDVIEGDKTINYVCNNEYAVFMYPSSYGNITTILDENGFNCTTDFTLSTTTIDSVSYNVYVSNNPFRSG